MQDLEKFKNDVNASGQNVYVGHRYVPKHFGQWDNTQLYEPLSIVQYQGDSFTSRQYVPIGIEITNEEYWASTGNYNAQVEQYRQDVKNYHNDVLQLIEDSVTKDDFNQLAENTSFIFNVKNEGANGNGLIVENEYIQLAIDKANAIGGGIVYIPEGRYLIDVTHNETTTANLYNHGGLHLKSNVTLLLSPNAALVVKPNRLPQYNLIFANHEDNNIKILNGTLEGDKENHDFSVSGTHEWGYGVSIQGSHNVVIDNVTATKFTGDGFNLQVGYDGSSFNHHIENVLINNVISNGNRRQGLSIESGNKITVSNSIFRNTKGTPPEAGIDIEPWDNANITKNVVIENCLFENNNGGGLISYGPAVSHIFASNNTFNKNGGDGDLIVNKAGGEIVYHNNYTKQISITETDNVKISDNDIQIIIINGSNDVKIFNNVFKSYLRLTHSPGVYPINIPNYQNKGSKNVFIKGNIFEGKISTGFYAADRILFIETLSSNIFFEENNASQYNGFINGTEGSLNRLIYFKNNTFKNINIPFNEISGKGFVFEGNIFEGISKNYYVSLFNSENRAFNNIVFKYPQNPNEYISDFGYTLTKASSSTEPEYNTNNLFIDNSIVQE